MFVRLAFAALLVVALVSGRDLVNATRSYSSTVTASKVDTVVIDPGHIMRTIPTGFYGVNYVGFWDNVAGSRASARALAQTPIRTVRFPGGAPADWYDWQDPYYKGLSHTSPAQLWRYTRSFGGTHVLFGTNYQGHIPNPPGKSYAVNSPNNAAAWVQYDKQKGIKAAMEVGNEEDMNLLHKADDPSYESYIRAFNAQAAAMHHANTHVQILGPVGTNEYYWWGLDGLGAFLAGTGNRTGTGRVDGVSLHFYKGTNWLDARSVAQYWLSKNGPWNAVRSMIHAHDTRNLPVYITEWNVGGADQNSVFEPTLGHALANADMIGAFALSGVAQEDYFYVHGGHTWGLLYGKGEDKPVDSPTPTYYAMSLLGHLGTRMVDLKQSDDAATMTSTYATTRTNGSVQVLVINKQPSSRRVVVALQGASPAGHRLRVYSLQGLTRSVEDRRVQYDGVTMPSPQQPLPGPKDAGIVRGRTVSYSVPGYSAVVLDLSGTSRNTRIRWSSPVQGAPAPPITFSVEGKVGQGSVKAGSVRALAAVVRSNQDAGSVLLDLEVYNAANAKVFQDTKTFDLLAHKPVSIRDSYAIPSTAPTGTYQYKIGVFGPNWSPLYSWDNAGSFTVTRQ